MTPNLNWIDTHCHLDAGEFADDRDAVLQRARAAGVRRIVLPAVAVANFNIVRGLAQREALAYALGIHPLFVQHAADGDLQRVAEALHRQRDDPRLVAVGEIGLDHFVPGLDRQLQQHFYLEQLRLARELALPVILHVRRSADALLAGLRRIEVPGGIAHAFNGSEQQADEFVARGFRLGFGGAMTFERALKELEAIVGRLERGDVELEESINIYERGEALKEHCDRLLKQAEAKVEKLTLGGDGTPRGTEPLDPQE